MFYAKVIGKTYSSFKHPALARIGIKIIQDIDIETQKLVNDPILALDAIGVSIGEFVGYEVSLEGTWAFEDRLVPSDSTIVAIIDSIDIKVI